MIGEREQRWRAALMSPELLERVLRFELEEAEREAERASDEEERALFRRVAVQPYNG